jgi:hypothetical protein
VAFWRKLIVVFICASFLPLRAAGDADAAAPIPVYVFAGQSNMTGAFAKAAELPAYAPHLVMPQKRVLFWGPTADYPVRWAAIEPPTEVNNAVFRNGFGPELAGAYRLASMQPSNTIAVFKFSRNGTNLYRQWHPNNPVSYYHQMMYRLAYARRELTEQTGRPTKIAGFFWMQGENDAVARHHAEAYGRNLMNLIAHMRHAARDATLPVVVGRILDVRRWYRSLPYSDIVRYKQYQVAEADPYTRLVYTDRLTQDLTSRGHFDTKGNVTLGDRMGRAFAGL